MKRKKRYLHVPSTLNITSLLDVLTVLLFFLIKLFSVNSTTVTIPQGLVLPDSVINNPMLEATSLAITKNKIWIDSQPVISIQDGHVAAGDLQSDGRTIKVIYDFLKKEMEKRNKALGKAAESLPSPKLVIKADKKVPFSLLKLLLHTATLAGYTEYQFLVKNKDM